MSPGANSSASETSANPQLHVFLPPKDKANGTCVVVCPGGGFNILAWDLEGTEVAEWLNSIGVAAAVLKYRVPTGKLEPNWLGPQMDGAARDQPRAQPRGGVEARSRAHRRAWLFRRWHTSPIRLGARISKRAYEPIDDIDTVSCRPDFAAPIYAAYAYDDKAGKLRDDVIVPKDAPPFFFVHAWDDKIDPRNSLLLGAAVKAAGVPCEVHVYDTGGHGYGAAAAVRKSPSRPGRPAVREWMDRNGWLTKK